MEKHRF